MCTQDDDLDQESDNHDNDNEDDDDLEEELQDVEEEIKILHRNIGLLMEDKKVVNEARQLDERLPEAHRNNNTHVKELENKGYIVDREDLKKGIGNVVEDIKGLMLETQEDLEDAERRKSDIIDDIYNKDYNKQDKNKKTDYKDDKDRKSGESGEPEPDADADPDSTPMDFGDFID